MKDKKKLTAAIMGAIITYIQMEQQPSGSSLKQK